MIPNFLIIGAQKCGTTWLHKMLSQHPDIFMPKIKELEFFSYASKQEEIGLSGYFKCFADGTGKKAIGEATPSYLWNCNEESKWNHKPKHFEKNIPLAVKKALGPEAKFIISLRNPVDRAVSAYFHHIKKGRITIGEDLLKVGDRYGIIHLGFYYKHLMQWLQQYDRKNFLILFYESDIAENKQEAMKKIYRFLNVSSDFEPKDMDKKINKGLQRIRVDNNYYVLSPENKQANRNSSLIRTRPTPKYKLAIKDSTLKKLREIYREDVESLSSLLGKDLFSLWKMGESKRAQ